MYLDEILLYLTVAGICGVVTAVMIHSWNRPFFRANRKAHETVRPWYPMPIGRRERRW